MISPAFKNWTQDPYPFFSDIEEITTTLRQNLFISISHGHDDHLDDFLLASKTLQNISILIPKLKSPGLKNRIISANPERQVIEISEDIHDMGDLKIRNLINPDFTGDDTVFIIEDSESFFIHANDNWHKYSPDFTAQIKRATGSTKPLTYAVQLGIADCFPAAYNYSERDKHQIIEARFESYFSALQYNSNNLAAFRTLTYANQSNIPAFNTSTFYSNFKKSFFNKIGTHSHQLLPGERLNSLTGEITPCDARTKGADTLRQCLHIYEQSARAFIIQRSNLLSDFDFKFAVKGDEHLNESASPCVTIEAYPEIWAAILTGNSNIECITVGGCGYISKPHDLNISRLHHSLCKWTYMQQARIRQEKFDYFLNSSIVFK